MNDCDVSVVVVSWNSKEFVSAALDSVPVACAPLRWEVVVVDNASSDGTRELLLKREDICVVTLDRNTGFTHAANLAASRARGRFLLFLNPDVVLSPGSVAMLARNLDSEPEAWAATPRFRNPDGTLQLFWRRLPTTVTGPLCFTHRGRRLDAMFGSRARRRHRYEELQDRPTSTRIETVGAACLLVRREDFEAQGMFDPRYFNFFQDTDLARRMHRAGRFVLGVGAVEVDHHLGVSFRQLPPVEVHGQLLRGLYQYLRDERTAARVFGRTAIWLDTVGRESGKGLRSMVRPRGGGRTNRLLHRYCRNEE